MKMTVEEGAPFIGRQKLKNTWRERALAHNGAVHAT